MGPRKRSKGISFSMVALTLVIFGKQKYINCKPYYKESFTTPHIIVQQAIL